MHATTRQLEGAEELEAIPYYGLMYATIRAVTGAPQPPPLQQLLPEIAPRPVLLIATGEGVERTMNRAYHRAAPATTLWELPRAGHTLGLEQAPRAYEDAVIGFFDDALLHLEA